MTGTGACADAGSRILLRRNQPKGFAVEANVLDNPFNLQVYHRPEGSLCTPALANGQCSFLRTS